MLPSEYQEQAAVVEWWGVWAHTVGYDERLLFAIPNGAHLAGNPQQRAIQVRKLKSSGMRPGMMDLMLAVPTPLFPGMFIEMKRKRGGKVSEEQSSMTTLFRGIGYNVIVALGADEAIHAIKAYLK